MKKVVVNGKYTYETDIDVQIGDIVLLPSAGWLDKQPWQGTITALNSTYTGECRKIIAIVNHNE